VVPGNSGTRSALRINGGERPVAVRARDKDCSGARPVKCQVLFAIAVVVKREHYIVRRAQVVAGDAVARVALRIGGGKSAVAVRVRNERGAGTRTIEQKVILAIAVIIERQDAVAGRPQVVTGDPVARIALRVSRGERSVAIGMSDKHRPRSGAIEQQILLAVAVIVKGQGLVARRAQIVAGDAAAGIALRIDRGESAIAVGACDERSTGARAIQEQVLLAVAVEVERDDSVVGRVQVVAGDAVAGIALLINGGEGAGPLGLGPILAGYRRNRLLGFLPVQKIIKAADD